MNALLQLLLKIALSLATEKVARELIAAGLEQIKLHTENKIDDAVLEPVIKALRGEG